MTARWSPILAALLLVGCSTIKFADNNVDWMLLSKADHYLDLSDARIDYLQARFEERNRDFKNDFVAKSMKVRLDRRVERGSRIFELFIGELGALLPEKLARDDFAARYIGPDREIRPSSATA